MRCRNCGAENDDSRFICENCGSPLYDENDEIINDNNENYQNDNNENNNDDNNDNKKRNIIIISIVAAVVVIALIVGLVFAFSGRTNKEPSTESQTVSLSTPQTQEETTTKKTTTTTKKQTTEEQKTTEATTESTTTTTTTTVKSYHISVDIDGNGSVSGEGSYKAGKKATLIATADEGYQFVGWYDNSTGALVASGTKYTVTVKNDLNLTAKFSFMGAN